MEILKENGYKFEDIDVTKVKISPKTKIYNKKYIFVCQLPVFSDLRVLMLRNEIIQYDV